MSNEDAQWVVPSWTYDDVKALRPCKPGFQSATALLGGKEKWNAKAVTLSELKDAGLYFWDILWLASAHRGSPAHRRRLRLWTADCAARVLPVFAAEFPAEPLVHTIRIAREYAKGKAGDYRREVAHNRSSSEAFRCSLRSPAYFAALCAMATCIRKVREAAHEATLYAFEAGIEPSFLVDRLILWVESQEEPEVWPLK